MECDALITVLVAMEVGVVVRKDEGREEKREWEGDGEREGREVIKL